MTIVMDILYYFDVIYTFADFCGLVVTTIEKGLIKEKLDNLEYKFYNETLAFIAEW